MKDCPHLSEFCITEKLEKQHLCKFMWRPLHTITHPTNSRSFLPARCTIHLSAAFQLFGL